MILIPLLLSASVVLLSYLVEPPPQDHITKRKTKKKSQNSNEVKNGCTPSRIRIDIVQIPYVVIIKQERKGHISNCQEVKKVRCSKA